MSSEHSKSKASFLPSSAIWKALHHLRPFSHRRWKFCPFISCLEKLSPLVEQYGISFVPSALRSYKRPTGTDRKESVSERQLFG